MKAFKLGIKVAAVAGLTALLSISASAAIKDSKHDLRGDSLTSGTKVAGATEICVFCHTPHGTNTDTEAPLWNRLITGTQSAYTSSTLDGKAVLSGSPSLACLSCHDGSQAMNTVINAPSTSTDYKYDSEFGSYIGTASSAIKMTAESATFVANLGQNLRNDHPVAVPYAGGGWSAFDLSGTQSNFSKSASDPDFVKPATGNIGGGDKWWIDSEETPDGNRQKTDLILYNRASGTDIDTLVGYVECATCHDPHAGESQSFLRMGSNDNSQVCLACHIK
jgi:predicted CXXCH cytochrome family protein